MKLELSYEEVSVICGVLELKAREAQINARKCRAALEKGFWQERAETYKKVYKAVKAQREQYLQAVAFGTMESE